MFLIIKPPPNSLESRYFHLLLLGTNHSLLPGKYQFRGHNTALAVLLIGELTNFIVYFLLIERELLKRCGDLTSESIFLSFFPFSLLFLWFLSIKWLTFSCCSENILHVNSNFGMKNRRTQSSWRISFLDLWRPDSKFKSMK